LICKTLALANYSIFPKLTFTSSGDALLSVVNNGDGSGVLLANILHVFWGEVAEGRVLGTGKHLVVSEFPGLTTGHGEKLLKVVLDDHAGSIVDFGHHWSGVTHLLFVLN